MLVTVEDKALGAVTIPGTVIKMSETPGGFVEGAPLLGEHTEYYLKNLGYTDEEIKVLLDNKIIEIA